MSQTKLSLEGNNINIPVFPPRENLVSDIPTGDGKTANLFLQYVVNCMLHLDLLEGKIISGQVEFGK
jgi:hypothetical protein